MSGRARRVGCVFAFRVLSLGVIAASPMFAAGARAQQAAIVDPNAPKAGQSAHDAALAAAARRDYVTALELSKKAAAEGQPLDGEQVDFISGKAAQQQAANAEVAATKAKQDQAAALAQQIEARQQKDYNQRAKQEAQNCSSSTPGHIADKYFTSAAGEAGSHGDTAFGGKRITGAEDSKTCGG